ncbi:type III secretion system translocon protein [Edwardsiella ictaluri]|uniref:Type III secretion system translocon protein n=1 Tax=Edwardsiella ictaluri TaxID=67780 RepID=A0ABY8GDJ4_EDWIC|nr:type III secretion system translocon protein [Edwardsiella ictaluri]WFN95577.1 type III secretion system translocon protein [Edwardsiella ictaluri]
MNPITETRYTTPPLGRSGLSDVVPPPGDQPSVGAGALDLQHPLIQHHQGHGQDHRGGFQRPPAPSKPVTLRLAEGALNRILAIFGPRVDGHPLTVSDIERTPMEAMTLAASLLGVKALGDNAHLKALALEIREKGTENLRLRQNEDLRQQVDKAVEDQGKAQKAGIFSAIVDWIVSIAEVVSGIGKLLIGDFAGGAMDVAAGCSGLVKAACETLALIDKDHADKYQAIADVAGKVQLAFEIAGMVVDLVSVGRGVMAGKSIAKAAESVMEGPAGEALHNAMTEGSEEAIKAAAKEIGKEVAGQVSEEVIRNLAEQSGRFLGQGALLKALSKEAIEQMVTRAVETAVKNALKSGGDISLKELTKQVVKEVQREVIKAIIGACITSVANNAKSTTRATLQGTNGIYQGVITKERAELQKVIQQLMNESSFMQFMLDEFEKVKKTAQENISSLMDGAGKALSAAADTQQKTGAMLSSIAAHIA